MSKINIHETAFVTSHFRAGNEEISGDLYARLWPTERTREHAASYVHSVSQYEPMAHCLRNRYFLESIAALHRLHPIGAILNFGCGFSMYPYLLPESIAYFEIDKKEVVTYKEARTKLWCEKGILPKRHVRYLAFDFKEQDYSKQLEWLLDRLGNVNTFILLEGVLFFLDSEISDRLFNLFSALQQKGSYVGSVSFRPSLTATPVFNRLISYVEQGLNTEGTFHYYTVADDYYNSLANYRLIDQTDSLSLAAKYQVNEDWDADDVLVEQMYVLKKE